MWTSPIPSVSGCKYYLVTLDFSHYLWTFPLRLYTFPTLSNFFAYVAMQFGVPILGIQCDNGREFDNHTSRAFFLSHGVQLWMSCPYTSPQNGKAERIIRSINNVVRSLLFQASVPPAYWFAALSTATLLLNILTTKTINFSTPHMVLYGSPPSYDHLRVFGCRCYPNLSPQTRPSIFLVSFSGIPLITKATAASTGHPTGSSSPGMWSLMRHPSHSLRILVVPHPRILSF